MKKADLILKNGFIYTVDEKRSTAGAVAVEDGKIVYVGDMKGVEPFIGGTTEVIDLDGKILLPGFVEAHAHPFMALAGCPESLLTCSRAMMKYWKRLFGALA